MLIFFDTEFTGLHWEAKQISIGLKAEDGRVFYAELSDTYEIADCGDFVCSTVLPLLEGSVVRIAGRVLAYRHRRQLAM